MKDYWYIVIVLLVLALIIALLTILVKEKAKKRRNDIVNIFKTAALNTGVDDYNIEFVKKDAYDLVYEDDKRVIYVKIVYNPANREICVNNAIKWQLRTHGGSEEMSFVEGIEALMRMDVKQKEKYNKKVYIVYPSARALLKVINECEMVFIYPETDVYGTYILSYNDLKENPELIYYKREEDKAR